MSKSKNAKNQWKRLADKRRWSEAEAREVVEAWRTSGQRVQTFAREQGLPVWRLRYWAPRVVTPAGSRKSSKAKATSKPRPELRFVPAVITGEGYGLGPAVVIRLPDGIAVEVHAAERTGAQEIGELVARLRGAAS
jgi:hypothetical protein